MTVQRIMGIETEYGIIDPSGTVTNPMLLSSHIVLAYRNAVDPARQSRWDYRSEDPLQDARGHRLHRAAAHPSMLTDDPLRPAPSGPVAIDVDHPGTGSVQSTPRPSLNRYEDPGAANSVLTNGGRLYVDHAHPEYSSPEVLTPTEAVCWDKAGEEIMRQAAVRAALEYAGGDIVLYKNNTDGKGASYGTHENYLVDRSVPFTDIVDVLTPFLVTRQIFTGSGRVGIGAHGEIPGFQLSQRADFIEAEVGLETTLRRPIINTRDEPHADRDRWRRLHLIIGDANLFEVATWLKLGTTSLVLSVLEHGSAAQQHDLSQLRLLDPVAAVQQVSRDLTLRAELPLKDGRSLTALEIQRAYLHVIDDFLGANAELRADDETQRVLAAWRDIIDRLDEDWNSCARDVEWIAKYQLIDRMRRRGNLEWSDPKLAAFDLQWSDIRPERGIYYKLLKSGAVNTVVDPEDVMAAVLEPPSSTRAYFRGRVMSLYADSVSAASWESIVFDLPEADSLTRLLMSNPYRGTRELVQELLTASPTGTHLVSGLQQSPDVMNI